MMMTLRISILAAREIAETRIGCIRGTARRFPAGRKASPRRSQRIAATDAKINLCPGSSVGLGRWARRPDRRPPAAGAGLAGGGRAGRGELGQLLGNRAP